MNGGQDIGGTHGHGPVKPEPNEPVFHGEWEKRAFALTLAMGMPGGWNIDMSRFARENRKPNEYLDMTYYQIWLAGLETLMKERGLVAEDEIEAGPLTASAEAGRARPQAGGRRKDPASRRPDRARHQHQARVRGRTTRARQEHQSADPYAAAALCARPCRHHRARARLPRVSRTAMRSARAKTRKWLYTVRFDGRELWGDQADPTTQVSVDAWEPYLERV